MVGSELLPTNCMKPENFLLSDDTDDADIKFIDFGLSRRNNADFGIINSRVGTYYLN